MNILAPVILAGSIAGLMQLVDLDRPGQFSWEAPGSFGVPSPGAHDSFGVPSPGSRDDIGLLYDMRGAAPVLADPRQQLLLPPLPAIGSCMALVNDSTVATVACGTSWPGLNGATPGAGGSAWAPWP